MNRSTGYIPNRMMLGREVNTPADLMFPQRRHNPEDPDYHVSHLTQELQTAHEIAREKLKTSSKRMKRKGDLRILERRFQEGDAVYVLDTAKVKGKCTKLSSPWKGPAVITKKLSAYRIKLQRAVFVANHDRLKPCHDRT